MQGHIDRLLEERFEERRETRGQKAQAWQTLLGQAAGGGLEGAQLSAQLAGTEEAPQAIRNVARTRIPSSDVLYTQIQEAYGPGRDYFDIPKDPAQDIQQIQNIFGTMGHDIAEYEPRLTEYLGQQRQQARSQQMMTGGSQAIQYPEYTNTDEDGNPTRDSDVQMVSVNVPNLVVMEAQQIAMASGVSAQNMPFKSKGALVGHMERLKRMGTLDAELDPETRQRKAALEYATAYSRQTAVNLANWEDMIDHWEDHMAFKIEAQVMAGARSDDLKAMFDAQIDLAKVLPKFQVLGELWNDAAPQLRRWMLDMQENPEELEIMQSRVLAVAIRTELGAKILDPETGLLHEDVSSMEAGYSWLTFAAFKASPELIVDYFGGMPEVRKYLEVAVAFQPTLARYFEQRGNLTEIEQTNAAMMLPTFYDLMDEAQGSDKFARLLGGALAVPQLIALSRGYGPEDLRAKPLELSAAFSETIKDNENFVLKQSQLGRPEYTKIFDTDAEGNVLYHDDVEEDGNEILKINPRAVEGRDNTDWHWSEALTEPTVASEIDEVLASGIIDPEIEAARERAAGRMEGYPDAGGVGPGGGYARDWSTASPAAQRRRAAQQGQDFAQGIPPPETPEMPAVAKPDRYKGPEEQAYDTSVAQQEARRQPEKVYTDDEVDALQEEEETSGYFIPGAPIRDPKWQPGDQLIGGGVGKWIHENIGMGADQRLREGKRISEAERTERAEQGAEEYIDLMIQVHNQGKPYTADTRAQLKRHFMGLIQSGQESSLDKLRQQVAQ
jgi:hypothetical protein